MTASFSDRCDESENLPSFISRIIEFEIACFPIYSMVTPYDMPAEE